MKKTPKPLTPEHERALEEFFIMVADVYGLNTTADMAVALESGIDLIKNAPLKTFVSAMSTVTSRTRENVKPRTPTITTGPK